MRLMTYPSMLALAAAANMAPDERGGGAMPELETAKMEAEAAIAAAEEAKASAARDVEKANAAAEEAKAAAAREVEAAKAEAAQAKAAAALEIEKARAEVAKAKIGAARPKASAEIHMRDVHVVWCVPGHEGRRVGGVYRGPEDVALNLHKAGTVRPADKAEIEAAKANDVIGDL